MAKKPTAETVVAPVAIKVGLTEAINADAKTALNKAIADAKKAGYSTNAFECPLSVKDGYSGKCLSFGQRIWAKSENEKGQILYTELNVDGKKVKVNFTDDVYFASLGIGSTVVFNVVLKKDVRTAVPVTGTAEVTKGK